MGERETVGHISDPGKAARAEAGLPVVPSFDGFRAFAILGVVFLHLFQTSGLVTSDHELVSRLVWGSFGRAVEVLFIVSGFVVFLPTVSRDGKFGSVVAFAIRRGARLLPAYWLILLISLVLIAAINPVSPVIQSSHIGFPSVFDIVVNFLGAAVPMGMFIPGIATGFGLDPPVWTLSVEIGFYIVLPLVAVAFCRWPKIGLSVAALITIGWTLAFEHVAEIANAVHYEPGFEELFRIRVASGLQLPVWAYSFGIGMAGSIAWVRARRRWDREKIERVTKPLAIGAFLVAGVTAWHMSANLDLTRDSLLFSMIFTTAIAVFMVSLALAPPRMQTLFAADPIRKLGDISYGIYLSHIVLISVLLTEFDLPRSGNLWSLVVWTFVVIPISALYGYLSARFLEQPIRRWARKFGRRGEA